MNTKCYLLTLVTVLGASLCSSFPLHAQQSPEIVWQTNGHVLAVGSLVFAPDNSTLVSSGYDGTAKLWRISDVTLLRTFSMGEEYVVAVAVSPDGNLVATGSNGDDGAVRLWSVNNGTQLWKRTRSNRGIFSLAFSPDGTVVASGGGETSIQLRRTSDGFGIGVLEGHGDWVSSVNFSPDSTLLASGSFDRTAKLWRLADRALLHDLVGHTERVNSIALSPDVEVVATGSSDGTSRLWRVADGTVVHILESGAAYSVGFSSDGRLLATAAGPIKFWKVANGQLLVDYSNAGSTKVALSRDGKYFAYATGATIFLARMPMWITDVSRDGSEITLSLQGGSGRYQLQGRNSLALGQWENIGSPTTNTVITRSCLSPIFYRVQSLPNP